MKCLVIVAHPDDETIWTGGFILSNQNYDWEIISLCRKGDIDREPKFYRVCEEFGARCKIGDMEDNNMHDLDINEVIDRIKGLAESNEYDLVLTHGIDGEYGHKRHVDVHNAVKKMLESGELKCKEIFYFAYEGENEPGKFCNVDKSATKFINLPKDVYEKKRHLIRDVYGFDDKSFEVKSTQDVEAFKTEKK